MFDSYFMRKDSLRNFTENGRVAGFQLQVRITNYRGVFLSLHNGYFLEVDGTVYPRSAQRFAVNGKPPRSFDELKENAVLEHWDIDKEAVLRVYCDGGLSEGVHHIGILESILSSYGYGRNDQEMVDNPPEPAEQVKFRSEDICCFDLELQKTEEVF